MEMKASLVFMAAAMVLGGSWLSCSLGSIIVRIGCAPTRYTAAATASAILILDSSVIMTTSSPGCTLTQVLTTLSAPLDIKIFFILIPPYIVFIFLYSIEFIWVKKRSFLLFYCVSGLGVSSFRDDRQLSMYFWPLRICVTIACCACSSR